MPSDLAVILAIEPVYYDEETGSVTLAIIANDEVLSIATVSADEASSTDEIRAE